MQFHLSAYTTIVCLLLLIGIIIYYFKSSKRRKKPFYSKEETLWEQLHPDAAQKTAFTVFLIGDAGAPTINEKEPTLALLQSQMDLASENSIAFFLGDNIYPRSYLLTYRVN